MLKSFKNAKHSGRSMPRTRVQKAIEKKKKRRKKNMMSIFEL
jgi:hypothetical protein